MNYLTAVVPVRKNSQRVKNKNFKNFNNKNLLIYKIEKLKKIKLFDQIIVNTDSNEAIKIARKVVEINVNENDEAKAKLQVEDMCKKLLANLVIEDYKIL